VDFACDGKSRAGEIAALFKATFTASEGADEGALIGKLAMDLFEKTAGEDLFAFTCRDDDGLAGCIMFSRLRYPEDDRSVFVLAPVAVETSRQGRGIGQRLLRFGLDHLRREGIDVALTYGDPAYYGKVGFAPITEAVARAPLALQFPHGWLGQSLTERPLDPIPGPSRCVEALNSPDYW
jgi:putative acetyltransferase